MRPIIHISRPKVTYLLVKSSVQFRSSATSIIMGCAKSIPDSLKGSTVSTQLPPSEWRASTLALLHRVFPQDQQPWLLELIKGVPVWEDSDVDFRDERRLSDFRLLRPDNPDLTYTSHTLHPLWRLLSNDLNDVRNPVGSLLMSFSMALTRTNLDAAHDIGNQPSDASFLLASLTANILKMTYVLREALIAFYTPIGDLLHSRHDDVEKMILDLIVQGDVYILMQRLANVLVAGKTEMMRKSIGMREGEERKEEVEKVRSVLMRFILTETVSEKRELLLEAETQVQGSKTLVRESLLARGLQAIEADLVLTRLLGGAPEFLYFLQECVDTCGS